MPCPNDRFFWRSALPRVHDAAVHGLARSPDGATIATFGRTADGKGQCAKLFSAAKGTLFHGFGAATKGIPSSVLFTGDGKLLAALFGDLSNPPVVICDAASHEEIRRITDLRRKHANGQHQKRAYSDSN